MKIDRILMVATMAAIVGGCAASKPKRDAYADAASVKRVEIDRLSKQIDTLRSSPDSVSLKRRIDSLVSVRSIAQASLDGVGMAVQEERSIQKERGNMQIQPYDTSENRKYPIKKH